MTKIDTKKYNSFKLPERVWELENRILGLIEDLVIEDLEITEEQTNVSLNNKYPDVKPGVILITPNVLNGLAYMKLSNGNWFIIAGQMIK